MENRHTNAERITNYFYEFVHRRKMYAFAFCPCGVHPTQKDWRDRNRSYFLLKLLPVRLTLITHRTTDEFGLAARTPIFFCLRGNARTHLLQVFTYAKVAPFRLPAKFANNAQIIVSNRLYLFSAKKLVFITITARELVWFVMLTSLRRNIPACVVPFLFVVRLFMVSRSVILRICDSVNELVRFF